MNIIKFGGGALKTPKLVQNAIGIIKNYKSEVLVVVSAIGRKGFPYATDTLIDSLKEHYLSIKEEDRLLSLGEIYSSIFLSNCLNKEGIKAYACSYLELGFECDDSFNNGNILNVNEDKIKELFKRYRVLIIPGFIGKTKDNEVITLGRGTSDFSATRLAHVFQEKTVYLYKDVDGVYPTMFINMIRMKAYDFLSYDEMLSLIDIDFNIVNKKAIIDAKKNDIEVMIINYLTHFEGTKISSKASGRKIIGFNVQHNEVKIASLKVNEAKEEVDILLKSHHIYAKEEEIFDTYFSLKIVTSQLLLVRQLLLNNYFQDLIR